MSDNLQFGIYGMRARIGVSILLISVLIAGFVFYFSKNNRDIAALNRVTLEIASLTDSMKPIISSAERIRIPQSSTEQEAHLSIIAEHYEQFGEKLRRVDEAFLDLDSNIQSGFGTISNLNGDPFWMYRDFYYRVEELVKIKNYYKQNALNKYVDFKGQAHEIDNILPYRRAIERMLSVSQHLIAPTDPEQTHYLSQRLGEASQGIKDSIVFFMILGGTLLFLIYFLIYLPMEGLIMQQIRKLEVANVDVQKAAKVKSEFLANMSHEIRTPMNGVMGMTELLVKTKLDDRQKAFADIILKSGTSLLSTINDILDFSKIDAGELEFYNEPFVLNQLLEDTVGNFYSKAIEKDVDLITSINPDLPRMFVGDAARIKQVMHNLLSNAIKFTESGYIRVRVTGDVGDESVKLKFSVKDTGIGIKSDKCAHIFEKFSQADESATRKHDGAGLGLAICASLVRLMGGQIRVKSKLGSGSTFYFTLELPIHMQDESTYEVELDQVSLSNVKGARIVVVDENRINCNVVKQNLETWDFDVASIDAPHDALRIMKQMCRQGIKIHCLLLDFNIKTMKAEDFIEEIRSNAFLVDIPIVLLTAVDQLDTGKQFSTLGIQAHLIKPVHNNSLRNTLVKVIDESRKIFSETKEGIAKVRALNGNPPSCKLQNCRQEYVAIDQIELANYLQKNKTVNQRNKLVSRRLQQNQYSVQKELLETKRQSA